MHASAKNSRKPGFPMAQPAGETGAWARRVESDSLRHPAQVMKLALKTWHSLESADAIQRFQLVDEVAQDRGPELTLAFRSAIMVAAGFRRRIGRSGRPSRTQEPCIVFVVKDKWPDEQVRENDPQKIPRYLLAHATVDGLRVPCVVPTDVQPQEWFHGARPQGAVTLQVGSGQIGGTGAAACAVQLGVGPHAMKLLMSAHHVFSPFPDVAMRTPRSGSPVSRLIPEGGPPFATSSAWGGAMRADGQPSFDVQFAKVSDWAAARSVLSGLRLSANIPYAGSAAQVMALGKKASFEILVPADNPEWRGAPRPVARVALDAILPDSYGFDCAVRENGAFTERHLVFRRLVRMRLLANVGQLLPGDSGSAVVVRRADGTHTLIGLFIASGNDYAYAIPAWQLFDTSSYARLPGDGPLVPVAA